MAITINQQNCNGCGICMDACAAGAIYLVDKKAAIDESRCMSCGKCIEVCPAQAIRLVENVIVPQRPTAEVPSPRTPLWPTIKSAVVTLGSTLAPIVVSKIGDFLVSAMESKPDRSTPLSRKPPASGRQTRRRYRGGR